MIFLLFFYGSLGADIPLGELFFGPATALCFISCLWRRFTTEITVTDRRVVFKRGFIWRATFEMNMAKVESVHVKQSIFGRMLGYGDIVIRGTGSSFEPLKTISGPLRVRAAIH